MAERRPTRAPELNETNLNARRGCCRVRAGAGPESQFQRLAFANTLMYRGDALRAAELSDALAPRPVLCAPGRRLSGPRPHAEAIRHRGAAVLQIQPDYTDLRHGQALLAV